MPPVAIPPQALARVQRSMHSTGAILSQPLTRHIAHLYYEFIRIQQATAKPVQNTKALVELTAHFVQLLEQGLTDDALIQRAELAEETLREIRELRGSKNFFKASIDTFYQAVSDMNTERKGFVGILCTTLDQYRQRRDAEEARFLQPYHVYRDSLRSLITDAVVSSGNRGIHSRIEERIKRDVLAKIQNRAWSDMNGLYDLVGFRIIVGNQMEVDVAASLIAGALRTHAEAALANSTLPYYFAVDTIRTHLPIHEEMTPEPLRNGNEVTVYNGGGYRAKHVRVDCALRGSRFPVAEIQIMSAGMYSWAKIQRELIYKEDQVPTLVKEAINAYCHSAADYILGMEEGELGLEIPDFAQVDLLDGIGNETVRSAILDRIADMDDLLRHPPFALLRVRSSQRFPAVSP